MTQVNQETQQNEVTEVTVAYADGKAELSLPLSGDLVALLALQETRELLVHGKPLMVDAEQINSYLQGEDSAVQTEEDLIALIESQISKEDVVKIYNQQLHRKLVGQQFEVSEVGDFKMKSTEELVLVVPKVKLAVEVVEKAIEAIESDDLSKYVTFLPPETEEEKLKPVRCVTGNTLRTFLNEMQTEEGGLDMNSQILVYSKLLLKLPDDDPSKKYGLMQMRALMQYADVVSNRNIRLALTRLIEEEDTDV